MRWRIDDVPSFVAVAETRSVTQAARLLDVSKSTVSKSLTRLEEGLGVRLLERNSRNVRITSDGETFYRHALQIMEQVNEADSIMAGLIGTPHGRLVVALPIAFARECIAPRLADFARRHPRIELELIVTSHAVDILRDQIDIAVMVGSLADSELVSRPVYRSELIWVTTPGYAEEQRLDSASLDPLPHVRICEKRYAHKQFPVTLPSGASSLDLSGGIIHANDPLVVREVVLGGAGVSLLPDQYCHRHLADGALIRVFERVRARESASTLSAVYPGRRLLPGKTRAFLGFLDEVAASLRPGPAFDQSPMTS